MVYSEYDIRLSDDEIKLLVYYFFEIKQANKEKEFNLPELAKYLKHGNVKQPNEGSYDDKVVKEIDEYYVGESFDKVKSANESLRERGLINLKPHQHDDMTVFVSLSVDGCDLGKKYSSRWMQIGLWLKRRPVVWILRDLINFIKSAKR